MGRDGGCPRSGPPDRSYRRAMTSTPTTRRVDLPAAVGTLGALGFTAVGGLQALDPTFAGEAAFASRNVPSAVAALLMAGSSSRCAAAERPGPGGSCGSGWSPPRSAGWWTPRPSSSPRPWASTTRRPLPGRRPALRLARCGRQPRRSRLGRVLDRVRRRAAHHAEPGPRCGIAPASRVRRFVAACRACRRQCRACGR